MIKLRPLGGLREIGANMLTISSHSKGEDEGIIIDCGILFPDDDTFNIRFLIPDYTDLDLKKFHTLFLTHGHEDHIGGIDFLFNQAPHLKIVTTEATAIFLKKKNLSKRFWNQIRIIPYSKNPSLITVGSFTVQPFFVPHSTSHVSNLVIGHDPTQTCFIHYTDLKTRNAQNEHPINYSLINTFTKKYKNKVALIDVTNINANQTVPSEDDIIKELKSILSKRARHFITFFPSNLYRYYNILRIAHESGKKIVIIGRSMEQMLSGLISLDSFSSASEIYITAPEDISSTDDNVLYLISGCQGDFKSALRRVAQGSENKVKLQAGDIFIFSSRTIPGNEKKLNKIYNMLAEKGVEVITGKDFPIHVSGHPSFPEICDILQSTDCNHVIPVHGEVSYIAKFANLIKSHLNIPCTMLLNHDEFIIHKNKITSTYHPTAPAPLLIDGIGHVIEKNKISERRKIAESGLVIITAHLAKKKIRVEVRGLPGFIEDEFDQMRKITLDITKQFKDKKLSQAEEAVRIAIRNYLNNLLGYKPITLVIFL